MDDVCEHCQSLPLSHPHGDMCATAAAFDPTDDRSIGACFPCAARSKACSRGKIRRMDAPDRARPVRLVEDEDGVVRVVREAMSFEQARRVVLPDKIQDKDGDWVNVADLTPQQVMCVQMGQVLEKTRSKESGSTRAPSLIAGVKNKIQDNRDGERLVHGVEDRGLESGEISEGDEENEDEEMAGRAAEGLEVGTQRNKIQDKEVQRVNLRVPLRARVKSTYAARSAGVKNKIQDKVSVKERARRERAEKKRRSREETDALKEVAETLGEGASSGDEVEDEKDEKMRSGLVKEGEERMEEFLRDFERDFPGVKPPVLLPTPERGVFPLGGFEEGMAYMERLKGSGVACRSGVYKRMWAAKRKELNEAMLAYGKAMAEYLRLQGEVVTLEEAWKWWKREEDRCGRDKRYGESLRAHEEREKE